MFRVQQRHFCNSIIYHRPSITTINLYFRKFIAAFIALTTIVIVSCNCNYNVVSSFHLIALPSSTRRTINLRPTQIIEYKRKVTSSLKGSSSNQQKFSLETKQKKNQTTIKTNTAKKRTKRNNRNKVDNTLRQVKKDDINKLVQGKFIILPFK